MPAQDAVQRLDIGLHTDFDVGDLAASRIEEEEIGLSKLAADHIRAACRADCGVGDLGIGDENVARICRQIDDRRLTEGENERGGARSAAAAIRDAQGRRVGRLHLRKGVDSRESHGCLKRRGQRCAKGFPGVHRPPPLTVPY